VARLLANNEDKGSKEEDEGNKGSKGNLTPTATEQPRLTDDLRDLLKQLLLQQSEMINEMHEKNKSDNNHGNVSAVTAKKNPVLSQLPLTTKTNGDESALVREFEEKRSKQEYCAPDTTHDMEVFMRHNLEMARLIQENSELRKDHLLRDMISGARSYT
jgi:hypothetical protein